MPPDGGWASQWVIIITAMTWAIIKVYETVIANVRENRRIAEAKTVIANQVETHSALSNAAEKVEEIKVATNGMQAKLMAKTDENAYRRGADEERVRGEAVAADLAESGILSLRTEHALDEGPSAAELIRSTQMKRRDED